MLVEYNGSIGAKWNKFSQPEQDPFKFRVIYQNIFERLSPFKENLSGKTIIDAGCGNGSFIVELLKKLPSVFLPERIIGFDLSDTNIENSKDNINNYTSRKYGTNKPNIDLFTQNIASNWNIPAESADYTISTMVLMALPDSILSSAVKNIHTSLKPGGASYITIMHPETVITRSDRYKEKNIEYGKPSQITYLSSSGSELQHYHRSVDYYVDLLTKEGFSVNCANLPTSKQFEVIEKNISKIPDLDKESGNNNVGSYLQQLKKQIYDRGQDPSFLFLEALKV